jgi:hypothetical protein
LVQVQPEEPKEFAGMRTLFVFYPKNQY